MTGSRLGLLMSAVTVIRSAITPCTTSTCMSWSGLFVIITSRRVDEVGVIQVGLYISCVSLWFPIILDSLLFGASRLSFISPRIKAVLFCKHMFCKTSEM